MLKKLAQQKKKQQTSTSDKVSIPPNENGTQIHISPPITTITTTATSPSWSLEQIQQRIQDEISSCCSLDNETTNIEYQKLIAMSSSSSSLSSSSSSSLFSNSSSQHVELSAILNLILDDKVLQLCSSLHFPNIDHLLQFELLVTCETVSKRMLLQKQKAAKNTSSMMMMMDDDDGDDVELLEKNHQHHHNTVIRASTNVFDEPVTNNGGSGVNNDQQQKPVPSTSSVSSFPASGGSGAVRHHRNEQDFDGLTEDQRNSQFLHSNHYQHDCSTKGNHHNHMNRHLQQMQMSSTNVTRYTFEFVISTHFPRETPLIRVKDANCQKRMHHISSAVQQFMQANSSSFSSDFGFLRTLIDKVKDMVIETEKRSIEEDCMSKVQAYVQQIQNECTRYSKFVIQDHETSIREGKILIKSESGVIKSATYHNSPISLRTLLYRVDGSEIPDLIHETNMLCQLSHPNILRYIGYYLIRDKHYFKVVMEPISHGNLHDMLYSKKGNATWVAMMAKNNVQHSNGPFLLSIARSIAQGISYLHSQNIIHGNLKPHLIFFVDDACSAKLGIELNHCYYLKSNETEYRRREGTSYIGLPQYKSPEEFLNLDQGKQVDIYAYGTLLAEIYSAKKPWRDTLSCHICHAVTMDKSRPDLPEHAPTQIKDLITRCWSQLPQDRPTSDEVVKLLDALRGV